MTATEDWLRQMREKAAASIGFALAEDATSPDDAAEHLRIGAEVGVPPSVVAVEPGMFRKEAAARKNREMLADAPLTAAWLRDGMNGSLAKDDIPILTGMEKYLQEQALGLQRAQSEGARRIQDSVYGRATERGVRRLGLAPDVMQASRLAQMAADIGRTHEDILAEEMARFGTNPPLEAAGIAAQNARSRFMAVETMTPEDRLEIARLGAERLFAAREKLSKIEALQMSEGATRFRDEVLAQSENSLMGVMRSFASDPVGGAQFLLETAAETLPALAVGSAATMLSRSPTVGALTMGGTSLLAEAPAATMDFLAENGADLSSPEAALEVLGNIKLMREAQRRGMAKGVVIAVFDAVSGGVAGKQLSKSPLGDMLLQGIAQAALGGGGEAAGQVASGQALDWRDIVVEGLAELATSPVEVLGVGGRSVLRLIQRATTASEAVPAIDAMAAESKLKERAPDKFREALEAQGAGSLYVEAEAVREYLQARDLRDEDVAAWGVDPESYAEALASGSRVAVPVATYAAHVSGTEDAGFFAENATVDPEGLSPADMKRVNEMIADALEDAQMQAEAERSAEAATRAGDAQVFDLLMSDLRAAGQSRDVATMNARLLTAFYRTMGQRVGEDALDLFRSMSVRVEGPQAPLAERVPAREIPEQEVEAFRAARMAEADAAEDALRKDHPHLAQSYPLARWVRSKGGIRTKNRDGSPSFAYQELQNRGVDVRRLPGLFNNKTGSEDIDNLSDSAIAQVLGTDDTGTYLNREALLDALAAELSGQGPTPLDINAKAEMERIASMRREASAMSRDEIVSRLTDGQEYNQAGRLKTDTEAFRKWFGDSKVVDADGKPLVVYHGTDAPDFDIFKPGAWFSESKIEASAYSFHTDARMREKVSGKYRITNGAAELDGQALEYFGTLSDIDRPAEGTAYATDMGVFRYVGKGKWEVFDDLLVDYDSFDGDGIIEVRGGDATAAAAEIVAEYDDAVARSYPGGAGGRVYPVFLSIRNPVRLEPFHANRIAKRMGRSDEEIEAEIGEYERQGYDGIETVSDEETANPEVREGGRISRQWVAFRPEQIKSVFNRGTFDPNDPRILYQEKRASITFPAAGIRGGEAVIRLFESADLSSFLHESGHFFLEAFAELAKDGPDDIKADWQAIRDFLGNTGEPLTVAQHETFARATEAYLMEGKAPSLELADVFARFKAWLVRIYRDIRGLNVKMSTEIREVFDRMLATDAEIAAARSDMAMSPLFAEPPRGMAPGDFRTYQRIARRSAEQAEAQLLERTMAKVRREREAWFREERKAVRDEVTAEVEKRREYRLIEAVANRAYRGSDKEVPDMQISRKGLTEMFGDGIIPELSRTRLGGKRAIYGDGENTITPQEAADLFGFASASEMVETLQNTRKMAEAISTETDRRLTERHGDPLNDGSIEEEALAAIHNEQQAMTAMAEARHMAQQLGRSTRGMTATLYRQRARLMIGRMTVRDAMNPGVFLNAERRAAQAAQKAFAAVARGDSGKLAEALQAKEQQVLNGFLYNEARKVEQDISRIREKMRGYDKAKVRQKLEGGYIEQIDAILEDYDFRKRTGTQVARAESLAVFVERMIAEGREGELSIDPRLMDASRRKHYTRLSVDELRGLADTVENLDHLGRFKSKLIEKARKRDLDAVVNDVVASVTTNLNGNPPGRTEQPGEARRREVRRFLNWTLNADTMLREADGFTDLGATWTALKESVDAGMARLTERRFQMGRDLDALYGVYSMAEKRDMGVKRHNAALGGPFSKWDVIAIALNTGNEENYQRLTNPKTKGGFTPEQVTESLAALDERDWRFVQSVWDYVNTFWPEIEAKEKRQTGVAPKKVEAKAMAGPEFLTGGYYPIKYDSRLSSRITETEVKDLTDQMRAGRFGKAQTRNGHTKERVQNVTMPLMLDLSVLHGHLNNVLYDLEIGEAVNASWKILSDQRVKDAFREKGRAVDHEALEIWLQDVASGDRVIAEGGERILRHARAGFVISRLALNLSTALIQPSGIAQSAVLIGKKAVAKGTLDYLRNMQRWIADVTAVSPLMRERKKTFERDVFNVVGDLQSGPLSRWQKFQRDVVQPLSFFLMQQVQFYAVDMPTWVSAYQKEIGKSGDEARARTYADTMVKRAQGSGLMSDRGMLERGTTGRTSRQREFPRLLTALGSYMFAKANVAYEKTAATNFRNPAEAMMWAVDMALLFTFEAVLYAAVKGMLPGEEEDEAMWLAKQTGLSVMGSLPLFREFSGALQGYEAGGVLGSIMSSTARPIQQAMQGDADRAAVRATINAAGIWLHLPSTQVNNILNGFFDEDMSPKEPDIGAMLGMGGEDRTSLIDYLMGE